MSEPQTLDGLAQQNRARIEKLRSELQRSHAAVADVQDAESPTEKRVSSYPAELVAEVQDELEILASARTMFNRDELIRADLERGSRNPRHVTLALDLATDWRLASELFGDDQAQARVYSLQLIRYLAEAGDIEWAEVAVDRIGATLNVEASWPKGIQYDYVDTLSVYLRSVGIERFLVDPASYYDKMHLTERTSLEVQKAFYDSGILRQASATTLAQVRRGFWRYLGQEPPHG